MTNMEKIYKELQKKHRLPDFDLLDREFEISLIEEESFILRQVRKKIAEKIDSAIKFMDELLHPDSGFYSYIEADIMKDSDRDKMIAVYKRLMYFLRCSTELSFDDSDELNAEFINAFVREWPEIKKSLLVFVRKIKDSWTKEISKKEFLGYLG